MHARSFCLGLGCVLALTAPRVALAANYLNLEPVSSSFDMTTSGFTVECWVKLATLGFNPRIVKAIGPGTQMPGCGQPSEDGWVLIVCTSDCAAGHPRFGIQDGVDCPQPANASVGINDGAYHYLAGTYDGSVMSIYVDGVLAGTSTVGAHQVTVAGGRLRIGDPESASNPPDISAPFDGSIDDLRIWNVARTPSQIASDMISEIPNQAGLVAYWRFNNSSFVDQVSGLTLTPTGIVSFQQGEFSGGVRIGGGAPSVPAASSSGLVVVGLLFACVGAWYLRRHGPEVRRA